MKRLTLLLSLLATAALAVDVPRVQGAPGGTDVNVKVNGTVPLPSGAATEATLSTLNAKVPASPATDRVAAGSPFSVQLTDGFSFYDARQLRLLTSADVVTAVQGSAAALSGAWPVKLTDGTNLMPTGDAAARPLHVLQDQGPADGTTTLTLNAVADFGAIPLAGATGLSLVTGTVSGTIAVTTQFSFDGGSTYPYVVNWLSTSTNNTVSSVGSSANNLITAILPGATHLRFHVTTCTSCSLPVTVKATAAGAGAPFPAISRNSNASIGTNTYAPLGLDSTGKLYTLAFVTDGNGVTAQTANNNATGTSGALSVLPSVARASPTATTTGNMNLLQTSSVTGALFVSLAAGSAGSTSQLAGNNLNGLGNGLTVFPAVARAAPSAYTAGNAVALETSTNGALFVQHTDGTNLLPTMDAAARAGFQKVTDGTNTAAVKAASTAAQASDPSVVMALSPNSPIPAGSNTIGKSDQGAANTVANGWPMKLTDGTNTAPTMDVAGRAGFQKITDGTNTMPTMDVAARAGSQKLTDGTNTAAVKAASTAAQASDPALVASLSPNSPLPSGANALGSVTTLTDGSAPQSGRVFDVDTGAGTENVQGISLRKAAPGGSVEAGTSVNPLRVDPTGTTPQPVSQGGAAAFAAAWPVKLTDGYSLLGTALAPLRMAPVAGTSWNNDSVAYAGSVPGAAYGAQVKPMALTYLGAQDATTPTTGRALQTDGGGNNLKTSLHAFVSGTSVSMATNSPPLVTGSTAPALRSAVTGWGQTGGAPISYTTAVAVGTTTTVSTNAGYFPSAYCFIAPTATVGGAVQFLVDDGSTGITTPTVTYVDGLTYQPSGANYPLTATRVVQVPVANNGKSALYVRLTEAVTAGSTQVACAFTPIPVTAPAANLAAPGAVVGAAAVVAGQTAGGIAAVPMAVSSQGVQYVNVVSPSLNPFLPRCNLVRTTQCQP